MNETEQALFDGIIDSDKYSQVEGFCEAALLDGARMALGLVQGGSVEDNKLMVLRYLYHYTNWRDFPLRAADRTRLENMEEGEDYG